MEPSAVSQGPQWYSIGLAFQVTPESLSQRALSVERQAAEWRDYNLLNCTTITDWQLATDQGV